MAAPEGLSLDPKDDSTQPQGSGRSSSPGLDSPGLVEDPAVGDSTVEASLCKRLNNLKGMTASDESTAVVTLAAALKQDAAASNGSTEAKREVGKGRSKISQIGLPIQINPNYRFLSNYCRKLSGQSRKPGDPLANPMKPMSAIEAMGTLVAVFLAFVALDTCDEMLLDMTEEKFPLELGSFGALATLLFGLPHAPASQPRAIFYGGFLVSLSIALTLYAPEDVVTPPVRKAMATAVVIAAQGFFGVVHPPAGAAAFIFAQNGPMSQKLRWWYLLFPLLTGNVLFVMMSTIFNNLFPMREYPKHLKFFHNPWARPVVAQPPSNSTKIDHGVEMKSHDKEFDLATACRKGAPPQPPQPPSRWWCQGWEEGWIADDVGESSDAESILIDDFSPLLSPHRKKNPYENV
jgi:hypothetical protein